MKQLKELVSIIPKVFLFQSVNVLQFTWGSLPGWQEPRGNSELGALVQVSQERDHWKAPGYTGSTSWAACLGIWWTFLSFCLVVYIWSCSQMRGIRGIGTTMVRIQTGPHHLSRNHRHDYHFDAFSSSKFISCNTEGLTKYAQKCSIQHPRTKENKCQI